MDQLSLNVNPTEDHQLSLDTGAAPSSVPADVASKRAKKAELGLSTITGQSYNDIYTSILNGQEKGFRQQAASTIDLRNDQDRQKAMVDILNRPRPDLASVLATQPKPTNPDTVIEQKYASAYTSPMLDDSNPWVKKSTVMREAEPEDRKIATDKATDFVQRRELAMKWFEDAQASYNQQSWLGWGVDQAKMMLPVAGELYMENKLRGNVPGAEHGLGLGDALEKERQAYDDMPFDQYNNQFSATMTQLMKDNPTLAVQYAHAVVGQSSSEIAVQNEFSVLGISEAAGFSSSLTKAAWAKKAAGDVVKSSFNVDANGAATTPEAVEQEAKVNQAAGLGDMGGAAVQKMKYQIYRDVTGKSTVEDKLVQPLNTRLRLDAKRWTADPGNAGQEVANRISERFMQQDADLANMLTNAMRVNRAPILQASEDVLKMVQQNIKGKYPGIGSTVLDISDDIWEPKSNTYHFKVALGDHDGQMFSDPLQAEEFARNYGVVLNEPFKHLGEELDTKLTVVNFQLSEANMKVKTYSAPLNEEFKTPLIKAQKELMRQKADLEQQLKHYRASQIFKDMTEIPNTYTEFRKSARGAGISQKELEESGLGGSIEYEEAKGRPAPADSIPAVTTGADIKQHGLGWYIETTIPNDETQSSIIHNMIQLWPDAYSGPASKGKRTGPLTPDIPTFGDKPSVAAALKAFTFGTEKTSATSIRTPGETLSPSEIRERVVATHGPALAMKMLQENDDLIKKAASGKTKKAFLRVLKANQTMEDPDTHLPGYFFQDGNELDQWYMRHEGRYATDKEHEGYTAYKRNYEIDRSIRFLGAARNMWRMGSMQYSIGMKNAGTKAMEYSKPFYGVKRDKIPRTADSALIAVGDRGSEKVADLSRMGTKWYEEFDQRVRDGRASIIQLHDPDKEPLHHYSKKINPNNRIVYAITDNLKTNNIEPSDLVPYRGGGHAVYDYGHKIVRADMVRDPATNKWTYRGDIMFSVEDNGGKASKIANHLTKVQKHIANGDVDTAKLLYDNRYGMNLDNDVLPHFNTTKSPDGTVRRARFSKIDEPFRAIPMNKTLIHMDNDLAIRYGKDFVDGTKHGSLAKSSSIEFTGERDAYNVHTHDADPGKDGVPLYQYRPADQMDPVESLNRAMSRIVNSGPFMDDYKYFSVYHWLSTYMPYLRIEGQFDPDRVWKSPFSYFLNPEFHSGTPDTIKSIALSNRKKIQDFVGTASKLQGDIDGLNNHIYSSLFDKTAGKYIPASKLSKVTNPIVFTKNVAMNLMIGLFSPHIFFTQAAALTNALAINIREAPAALGASTFYQWLRFNPNHVDHFDKLATKFDILPSVVTGYKPGWFKEAVNMLDEQTGFFKVGSEHAFVPYTTDAIKGFWQQLSEKGYTPFREGAQMVRATAWFSAHLEWRQANPTKTMSRGDKADILARAADLDHNMSRAFSSQLNQGPLSITNMFMTYSERMAELTYGKRLTGAEKARLIGANVLLWGLPAAGLGSMILPIGNQARQQIIQGYVNTPFGQIPIPFGESGGYSPQRNPIWDTVMNGFPSYAGALITGRGDYQKGTEYDFSKYGVQGIDLINQILDTDTAIWSWIGGAPGSIMAQTWKNSSGFRSVAWSLLSGQDLEQNPLTTDDISDIMRTISTVNTTYQTIYAMETGKIVSRSSNLLKSDVSWQDSLFRGITGLTDVQTSDLMHTFDIEKSRENYRNYMQGQFRHEYHLFALYAQDGNDQEANAHLRKANNYLNTSTLDTKSRDQIVKRVMEEPDNIVEKAKLDMIYKNVPEWQGQQMMQRGAEEQQVEQKQGK